MPAAQDIHMLLNNRDKSVSSGCNTDRPARVTTDPEYTEARHKGKQGPERPQGGSHLFFFSSVFLPVFFIYTMSYERNRQKCERFN